MKTKANKISAIIALALILIYGVFTIVSYVPKLTVAEAYDPATDTYSGREDAADISDFDDNINMQNRFKMWSIFKSMNMTDNQAVAALACSQHEGFYRSERVEGDRLGVSYGSTPMDQITYINTYSKYIDTDADWRTAYTDELLLNGYASWGTTQAGIDAAKEERDITDNGLSEPTYYIDGVGYPGCGLYQFTGESLYSCIKWTSERGQRWYNFEYQMAFFIAPSSMNGYRGDNLQQYIAETADADIDTCVERFFHLMINGNPCTSQVSARQVTANDLYPKFAGLGWDSRYGAKVLALADLEAISVDDKIHDRGIIYSYASTVLLYPRNKGMLVNIAENDNIRNRNIEVFTGYVNNLQGNPDSSTTYSLFELYGEDLHWYRYFGEATFEPTLLDHVWSAIDQNRVSDLISFRTINYDSTEYLSCNVYPERPIVLSKDDIDEGNYDPRVSSLTGSWFNGFFYVSGSIKMELAKFFVAIVAFMMGPEIRQVISNIIDWVESTAIWDVMKPIIFMILGFAMLGFIFSLVKKAVNYAKGTGAMKDAIERFLIGFLVLGLLFAAVARPSAFNNIANKVVNVVDNFFNAALADSLQNDEIIAVQDPTLATHAVLWKTAIFRPWCRGQFDNLNYDELYTSYATLGTGQSAMPQSHETIDPNDATGRAFYDSVSCTGDVFVPRGGGDETRNWAAYLYSCGTRYHIDSTLDSKAAEDVDLTARVTFPNFTTMTLANNPDIPADTFRIVDAQMNISPQYYTTGSINYNYRDSHRLKPHYEAQSIIMLFNASMLLFLMPMIFKKLMSFILLLITTIKLIYFTIMELFKEGEGFKPFFDSLKKHFFDYFTACLKLNIMVILYYILIDKGFIELFLYIACCIIILSFKWKHVKDAATRVKRGAQRIRNRM